MIQGISSANSVNYSHFNLKNKSKNNTNTTNVIREGAENIKSLKQVPYGYISFKGNNESKEEKTLTLTEEANQLLNKAAEIAIQNKHNSIHPEHIIQAAITETEVYFSLVEGMEQTGFHIDIQTPALVLLSNQFAGVNLLERAEDIELLATNIMYLKEENIKSLKNIEPTEIKTGEEITLEFTAPVKAMLDRAEDAEVDPTLLVAAAFDALSFNQVDYTSNFLTHSQRFGLYKHPDVVNEKHMQAYDRRGIEAWNKLALGSNLFITHKNKSEQERLEASLYSTLDEEKFGNFNSNNTSIFSFRDTAKPDQILSDINRVRIANPDRKLVFILDYGNALKNAITQNSEGEDVYAPQVFEFGKLKHDNVKLILMLDEKYYYKVVQNASIKDEFKDFIQYSIPPIQSSEVDDILKKNKALLKSVTKPFTKEAKEKAILLSDKMEGMYPDKAINLMTRIANYYNDDKKKITTKDVEEFAYNAAAIFNKDESRSRIIYNTGKDLKTYYGKETTKKDIINLVNQIKTGNVGTQGIVITSVDKEEGSGKKYTAEVIAGEAKVPFMSVNTSDFTITNIEAANGKPLPADYIKQMFSELKFAASQNEYKTAIMFIDDFEDLFLLDSYYSGSKQAKNQLIKEMEKAASEDVSIIVMGSTYKNFAEYAPILIKDFSRQIIVDSPAYNNASRKDVLQNLIKKENIQLAYRTKQEKEEYINKLVKLTEYCSYSNIKTIVDKASQITLERGKKKTGMGEFIEAYLQLLTGRTSLPDMPDFNKEIITAHECGHATNLEVMNNIYKNKGKLWFPHKDVNFITLDPRGDFLGAVFESYTDNQTYPFEGMFANIVCSYGGHSCEKEFFDMFSSSGPRSDFRQATAAAKIGIEEYGMGHNTGKISNAADIESAKYNENVYKDLEVILTNAQIVSDLITEHYRDFIVDFTNKYSKLIGTDNCMIDGDDFRKSLNNWIASRPQAVKEDLAVLEDIIMDIIKSSKQGKIYGKVKTVIK